MNGFLKFAASGMPGVGVAPFGTLLAFFGSGIPGVVFPDGGIGLVDKPSGKLFASTVTFPAPADWFVLVFDSAAPHAGIKIAKDKTKRTTKTFDINFKTSSI